MRCLDCGATMRSQKETYTYEPVPGLKVKLIDLPVFKDKNGHVVRAIPHLAGLHHALAGAIVRKRTRLSPPEIRFLRKSLGWSGKDFALYLGVTAESVSRWENGHDEMGPQADRLLRMMAVNSQPIDDYELEELKSIGKRATGPIKVGLEHKHDAWEMAGAA